MVMARTPVPIKDAASVVPAATAALGAGIINAEAGARKPVAVVQRGSYEVLSAGGVDPDGHEFSFRDAVIGVFLGVEEHLIGEP